ncbi:hypothetical protein PIB30_073973 [Stylosanthes scabra]|uniref:Uncharacterized protein n=1 Tax=Stylosanthes scabra TaxID=79078 RepID=A0ABU6WMR3_9FABA|nr:hypothetical protein [Stylosanthes scabra]
MTPSGRAQNANKGMMHAFPNAGYELMRRFTTRTQRYSKQEKKQDRIGHTRVTLGPCSKREPKATHSRTRPNFPQATANHVWTTPRRGPNVAHRGLKGSNFKHHKPRLDHA